MRSRALSRWARRAWLLWTGVLAAASSGPPGRRPEAQSSPRLSRHEICVAVAQGDPAGCRHLPHYPGRSGDCLLFLSLKLAAKGDTRACDINTTAFDRLFCAMIAGGGLRCGDLRASAAAHDAARSHFDPAERLIRACERLDSERIAECRASVRSGVVSDECLIALNLLAYQKRDIGLCAGLPDLRSRENCRVMLGGGVDACSRSVDFEHIDPPWWVKKR